MVNFLYIYDTLFYLRYSFFIYNYFVKKNEKRLFYILKYKISNIKRKDIIL